MCKRGVVKIIATAFITQVSVHRDSTAVLLPSSLVKKPSPTSNMNSLTTMVLLFAVVAQLAFAVPTPGKTDAAKIQKNLSKNKAKKTQEVLQFGNQQNRQSDTRNFARTEKKRQAPDDHHDPEPVPEVNNALENYPKTARHEKVADLFYNPDSYGLQSLDDRYKRNAHHFASPVKRSASRGIQSYLDSGRAKRDLDVDPEEALMALMAIWEAERRQKNHEQSRGARQHYGRLNDFDLENETSDEDSEEIPDGWLEGPVVPAPVYANPNKYYGNSGFIRQQRQAQRGTRGLSHFQEEPQYYRMSDYYRHFNY